MRTTNSVFLARALVMLFCAGNTAHGAVIYDNYTAGDGHHPTTGWSIGSDFTIAMPFTPGIDSYLGSVTLSEFRATELDLQIASDSGGLPGASLESFHLSGPIPGSLSPYPPIVVSSVLHPFLDSGTQYWLEVKANVGTSAGWFWTAGPAHGNFAAKSDFIPWTLYVDGELSVFRIESIPEPGTLALLGAGLLGLVALRRRAA